MSESQLVAIIETNKGQIKLNLFADKAPLTVGNFVNLVKRGYYDGLVFHRVIDNFMVQGGCPDGLGTGGPGYKFEDEFVPGLRHDRPGILSMANAGPKTNGSQFFITHVPTDWLDGKHTVFGSVITNGDMEVVNSIRQGDRMTSVTIQGDTTELLEKISSKLKSWNKKLDKQFPHLKPV